ncbi:MAG: DUF296 domain-containing protein [Methanobacteriota archaeon]|nr:MAG: DUF296 domain-containing protein [Euryarchaeota archaeon]
MGTSTTSWSSPRIAGPGACTPCSATRRSSRRRSCGGSRSRRNRWRRPGGRKMHSSVEGELVIAKLDDGEDLLKSIDELAVKHRLENAMVMWAIGMLRDLEIGHFNGKAYEKATYAEPLELVSLHGTYAGKADPKLHIHAAAASRDHRIVGGHVFHATVSTLNEVCLWKLWRTKMDRVLHPRSGLKELTLR